MPHMWGGQKQSCWENLPHKQVWVHLTGSTIIIGCETHPTHMQLVLPMFSTFDHKDAVYSANSVCSTIKLQLVPAWDMQQWPPHHSTHVDRAWFWVFEKLQEDGLEEGDLISPSSESEWKSNNSCFSQDCVLMLINLEFAVRIGPAASRLGRTIQTWEHTWITCRTNRGQACTSLQTGLSFPKGTEGTKAREERSAGCCL